MLNLEMASSFRTSCSTKWMNKGNVNVNKEEGRLRNELKGTTVKDKTEYFESVFHEII